MVGRRRARVRLHSKATSACRAWIMGAGRVWTSCWTSGRAEMIFARRTPAPSRRHDALAHRRAGTWDATMTKVRPVDGFSLTRKLLTPAQVQAHERDGFVIPSCQCP
jgi:hypothetical protein